MINKILIFLFGGIGGSAIVAIAIRRWDSIRKLWHRKRKIRMNVWENSETFLREVDSPDSPKDIGTVVYMGVSIYNGELYDITVTECKFEILAPYRFKAETTELMPYESEFFWNSPDRGIRKKVTIPGHLSVLYQTIKGGEQTEVQTIFFRVQPTINKTTRQLKGKLVIWIQKKPDKLSRRRNRLSEEFIVREGR